MEFKDKFHLFKIIIIKLSKIESMTKRIAHGIELELNKLLISLNHN